MTTVTTEKPNRRLQLQFSVTTMFNDLQRGSPADGNEVLKTYVLACEAGRHQREPRTPTANLQIVCHSKQTFWKPIHHHRVWRNAGWNTTHTEVQEWMRHVSMLSLVLVCEMARRENVTAFGSQNCGSAAHAASFGFHVST